MKTAGRRVVAVLETIAGADRTTDASNTELMARLGVSRRSVEYGLSQARAAGAVHVRYCPASGQRTLELAPSRRGAERATNAV